MRHGYGIAVFADGMMYEGEWVNGKEHGSGTWMTGSRQASVCRYTGMKVPIYHIMSYLSHDIGPMKIMKKNM